MISKKRAKKSSRKTAARGKKRSATTRAARTARSAPSGYKTNWRTATDSSRSEKQRVEAFARLGAEVCDDSAVFKDVLAVIRDRDAASAVRLAAVQAVQTASFSAPNFSACRPSYLAALRAVTKDPNPEIRQRALGILARYHDGHAQQLLLEGLQDPAKAAVPPEKALQLLSNDVKAEAYEVARRILQKPPNQEAKREALRLLAADAKSASVFEKILLDKTESPDVRQISAAALQALAPDTLQARAREIVLDTDESPDVQAMSLTALTQFGKGEELEKDDALIEHVAKLRTAAPKEPITQSAKQFVERYKR